MCVYICIMSIYIYVYIYIYHVYIHTNLLSSSVYTSTFFEQVCGLVYAGVHLRYYVHNMLQAHSKHDPSGSLENARSMNPYA